MVVEVRVRRVVVAAGELVVVGGRARVRVHARSERMRPLDGSEAVAIDVVVSVGVEDRAVRGIGVALGGKQCFIQMPNEQTWRPLYPGRWTR